MEAGGGDAKGKYTHLMKLSFINTIIIYEYLCFQKQNYSLYQYLHEDI